MAKSNYEISYSKIFVKKKEFDAASFYPDDEYMQGSSEYKQVFNKAEMFLKRHLDASKSKKSGFYILDNFTSYLQRNLKENVQNTWGGLATVFLLLTWYSLRILRSPWRKSYFKIKVFSGHFQHVMYENFSPALTEEFMGRIGYIYHKQQQTFFFNQHSLNAAGGWRDSLLTAGMDFFLVHVRCSLTASQSGRMTSVFNNLHISSKTSLKKVEASKSSRDLRDTSRLQVVRKDSKLEHSTSSADSHGDSKVVLKSSVSQMNRVEPGLYHNAANIPPSKQYSTNPFTSKRNAGSSVMPYEHRIKSQSAILYPSASPPQFSDDSDDMSLYEGRETTRKSPVEANVRYPPSQDRLFLRPSEDVMRDSRKSSRSVQTRQASKLHQDFAGLRSSEISHDNYVTAMPMSTYSATQLKKSSHSQRESRVESGYYSQWSPPSSSMRDAGHVRGSYQPYYPDKLAAYEYSTSKYPSRISRGEYVQVFPAKRPPAEGTSDLHPHIYQEISTDGLLLNSDRSSTQQKNRRR